MYVQEKLIFFLFRLSESALSALLEFQAEQREQQENFQKLYDAAEDRFDTTKEPTPIKKIEDFQEDWNLSQFWYNKETSDTLANEALLAAKIDLNNLEELGTDLDQQKKIVIISAPSAYSSILRILDDVKNHCDDNLRAKISQKIEILLDRIYLFEFDSRFKFLAKKFVHYDYNKPLFVPKELKGQFDVFIVDPPFLSKECHTKTALTARFLQNPNPDNVKMIVCTGERVSEIIKKVYPGICITNFLPQHANGLSNEFRCYSNFECESWKFSNER